MPGCGDGMEVASDVPCTGQSTQTAGPNELLSQGYLRVRGICTLHWRDLRSTNSEDVPLQHKDMRANRRGLKF